MNEYNNNPSNIYYTDPSMTRYGTYAGMPVHEKAHIQKSNSNSQFNDRYMGRYGIHLGMQSHEKVNHRPNYNTYNRAGGGINDWSLTVTLSSAAKLSGFKIYIYCTVSLFVAVGAVAVNVCKLKAF